MWSQLGETIFEGAFLLSDTYGLTGNILHFLHFTLYHGYFKKSRETADSRKFDDGSFKKYFTPLFNTTPIKISIWNDGLYSIWCRMLCHNGLGWKPFWKKFITFMLVLFYALEFLRNIFEIFISWLYKIKIEQKTQRCRKCLQYFVIIFFKPL